MTAVDSLELLATRLGVQLRYVDAFGVERTVPRETLKAVCDALGFRAETDAQIEHALRGLPSAAGGEAIPIGRAWQPFDSATRAWLLSTQLYAVRGESNWGMGDLGDLKWLIAAAGRVGAAGVGVNPLHALFPSEPARASPYSPSSRLYVNPLYLELPAIEDIKDCGPARQLMQSPGFQAQMAALRAERLVDYEGVAALKLGVLSLLYGRFADSAEAGAETDRLAAFDAYRHREDTVLHRFATFEVLRAALSRQDPAQAYWRHWPAELRRPDTPAVDAFAERHRAEVEYREYLQWQADLQLAACAAAARNAGMAIGLYADLAVGVDGGGADAWLMQDTLVPGFSMGAPPDPWSRQGQDWGVPPFSPMALAAGGFETFARLLRANMRHAGALRIDHILGLMRCFWVPHGGTPADGAYVRYPFADLLRVLVAESHGQSCMVVGEDLGSVPEGLRPALHAANVHSSPLLYFEQEDGRFRAPSAYPAEAAVSVTNHDLPTFAGWWSGADVELRARIHALPGDDRERALAERSADRARLVEALHAEGFVVERDEPPVAAVHRFIARTPCRLAVVQLDDAVGETDQINLPGTDREHPNWRRKIGCDRAAAMADPRMAAIAAAMEKERR